MTTHFTAEQLVDALDRPLSAGEQEHLAACAACAAELEEMRRLTADLSLASAVPEPSPLFWDFLSARIREAVDDVPAPGVRWISRWRVLASVGVLGAVVLVVLMRPSAGWRPVADEAVVDVRSEATVAAAEDPESEAMWDMIAAMAPLMPADAAAEAGLQPGPAATDAAIESLTDAERQELAKLLRAEMKTNGAHE